MRKERVNNAETLTVNGAVTISDTSVSLDGAANLPSEGDYRVAVGTEIMKVTARTGNALTVERGVDGTTANTHSDTSNAIVLATASGLRRMLTDAQGPHTYVADPATRLDGVNASSFTIYNGGTTSTLTDVAWGGVKFECEAWTGHQIRACQVSAPSTPWTLTIALQAPPTLPSGSASGSHWGLALQDSAASKFETLSLRCEDTVSLFKWSGSSWGGTYNSTDFDFPLEEGQWFRATDDGTNLEYFVSADGLTWFSMGSHARTTYLPSGPDMIGFYATNFDYNHLDSWILKSWELT